jgi:hypothetical protein
MRTRRRHRDDVHRTEGARGQARCGCEAAADRGVESFADDVDLAVVEMPVCANAIMCCSPVDMALPLTTLR